MPDHIGAFLRASECFSSLGINITRVSYNKAVDSHTLFIDAEGTEEQLAKADTELEKIGYLNNNDNKTSIVLLEFCLKDVDALVALYEGEILPAIPKGLCAAVYTQASDVEDETNGLLSYDRKVCKVTPYTMQRLAEKIYGQLKS